MLAFVKGFPKRIQAVGIKAQLFSFLQRAAWVSKKSQKI